MFAPDLCNTAYASHPLYEKMLELFAAPFRGRIARETVEALEADPPSGDLLRRPVATLDVHDARWA